MKLLYIILFSLLFSACGITETEYHEEYKINVKFQETCFQMVYTSEYQLPRDFTINLSKVSGIIYDYCQMGLNEFGLTTTINKTEPVYHLNIIKIQPKPYNF